MAEPVAAESTTAERTLVHYEVRDGVAYLTLDDPPANTYTHEMMRQLDEAILQRALREGRLRHRPPRRRRQVLLRRRQHQHARSRPTRTSSTTSACTPTRRSTAWSRPPSWSSRRSKGTPSAAASRSPWRRTSCIAKKGSGKVGLPEINLGVLPGTGGTQRLSRRVGKSVSIDLMVTGRLIAFEEAQARSASSTPSSRATTSLDQIHEYARQFCPPNKAAKAVGPHQARRCSPAGRCRSRAASPSSASCSSSSSRAPTPRRASTPTSRSASRSSAAIEDLDGLLPSLLSPCREEPAGPFTTGLPWLTSTTRHRPRRPGADADRQVHRASSSSLTAADLGDRGGQGRAGAGRARSRRASTR